MIQNAREEALAALSELAVLAPEIRLGQLMAHIGFLSKDQVGRSLWDVEDDKLLAVLHRIVRSFSPAGAARRAMRYVEPAELDARNVTSNRLCRVQIKKCFERS